MDEMWYTFATGFIISALGSVPFGVINLTIIQITLNSGQKAAFQFVGIALVAEYFHVWLAILLFNYIQQYAFVNQYFDWAAIVFILAMAFGSLTKKPDNANQKSKETDKINISIWKALSINFLNPFSIPFWLFFTKYAQNSGWIALHFNGQIYCIAATLGAMLTLVGYIFIGRKLAQSLVFTKLNIDKILGWAFVGMALWRVYWMVFG
ncbi:MAG: LysE family translocator [Cytophagales bacterium]